MLSVRTILGPIAAGLLAFAVCTLETTPAGASDDVAGCVPACHYETVTVYVAKTVAYTKLVTVYDSCGHSCQVARTCYRTVQVPVRQCVLVCDR
jgi:hypothetical protein